MSARRGPPGRSRKGHVTPVGYAAHALVPPHGQGGTWL
jgi:hypothetical protein